MTNISEIQITPIKPHNGLVAFASIIINQQFYVGDIAIYSSPSTDDGFRLVYPCKVLPNGKKINSFLERVKRGYKKASELVSDQWQHIR